MMRALRIFLALLFAVSLTVYVVFSVNNAKTADTVPPEISYESDTLEVSVAATDEELLAGMTATDQRDGDVTASLVVVSRSKFVGKGTLRVNYAAFDAAGNAATCSRLVTYTDYTSPRFTLSEPLRFSTEDYNVNLLDRISASDCIDGDITGLIKYTLNDNAFYGTPGETSITFQVSNSAGDLAELELPGEVLSTENYAKPYPMLTDYLVYTKVGQEIDPASYLVGVIAGGAEYFHADYEEEADYPGVTRDYHRSDLVSITSHVQYDTPGVYTVEYTLNAREVQGGSRYEQGTVLLYVVVEE